MDQAMAFQMLPQSVKTRQTERIMKESLKQFNHSVTARRYIELYEKMVNRQLIVQPMYPHAVAQ
jgi:starch synthase/alpha-amylase